MHACCHPCAQGAFTRGLFVRKHMWLPSSSARPMHCARLIGPLPQSPRLQAELAEERQRHSAQLEAERQRHAAQLAEERQSRAAELEAREAQHAAEVRQLMQRVAAAEAKVRSAAGWGSRMRWSLLLPRATAPHAGTACPSHLPWH